MWAVGAVVFFLQAANFYADGMKALDARNYAQAAELFSKAVAADPKDYASHFHLALSYSLLKRDPDGIAEYKKVLELKPGLYEAELNLGILLIRTQQPADAAPYLQQAVDQKPKAIRPRVYLAESLLNSGNAAKAEEQYRAALEIDPKSAAAEQGLGEAIAKQDRLADAVPHFQAAARLDPDFKDTLLELAGLYEKNHQTAEAIAIYQQFPDNVGARERLGQLLIEANRAEEAIAPLAAAVAKDPSEANRLALASAYIFAKQNEKALPLLNQCVTAEPENYAIRMMYGRAFRDLKQYEPAAVQFFHATKLKPDSLEAWKELSGPLMMAEKYPESLAALDRAHQLGDDSPGNYFFHALAYDKLHALKPALQSYQEFLARAKGQFPDQEWQAQQRAKLLARELHQK